MLDYYMLLDYLGHKLFYKILLLFYGQLILLYTHSYIYFQAQDMPFYHLRSHAFL